MIYHGRSCQRVQAALFNYVVIMAAGRADPVDSGRNVFRLFLAPIHKLKEVCALSPSASLSTDGHRPLPHTSIIYTVR